MEELAKQIKSEFNTYNIFIENGIIVVEDEYEQAEFEKNDDDCCDSARENGEAIIEKFSMLEIDSYYCHRHKYAIVNLKPKTVDSVTEQR